MKALHLVKTAVVAPWALRQIRVLRSLGVDAEVVLPEPGPMTEAYAAIGVTVHHMLNDFARMRSPRAYFDARRRFRSIVAESRPCVVHSHSMGTTLFARLALGRSHPTPRIFQVPGPLHLENPLARTADLASAGPSDFWVASCKATESTYLRHGRARERVGFSFYGMDLDRWNPEGPVVLRQELDIPATTRLVGLVAYVYRPRLWLGQRQGIKGHEDLIDALAILIDGGHDVAGVFVGSAWHGADAYASRIEAYARQRLGHRARFLGHRDDIPDIYRSLDIAVHPSHSENLGGASESLAMGVPTVATRVGGIPDIVVDGETGWLVEPKRPDQLAHAIAEALSDETEARRRAARGQAMVRSMLDVNRTAGEVAGIYSDILSTGRIRQT